MSVYMKIEGFDELLDKVKQVGDDKDKRRVALRFLRVAARDIRNTAKQKVPVKSGELRRSIGVITSKKKTYPNVLVGPRANKSFKGYHGHLIEKGFYNKRARKHIPAQPFMQPAYEQNKDKVSERVASQMAKFIQKEIDRLSK